MTLDLFDTPVLKGLGTRPNLIDAAEQLMLIERIDATDLTPFQFQGWTGTRLTTPSDGVTTFRWGGRRRRRPFLLGRARSASGLPSSQTLIPRTWLQPDGTSDGFEAERLIISDTQRVVMRCLVLAAAMLALAACSAIVPVHSRMSLQSDAGLRPSGTAPTSGARFVGCTGCPEMIVLPPGRFLMGSPETEQGRGEDEGPQRSVEIRRSLAIGRFEVTRAQYSRFVGATRRKVTGGCITDRVRSGTWQPDARTTFRDPGYEQTREHPVACVSWYDAMDYAAWLGATTGLPYRLLSEAEWEYAARAGSATAYPWRDDPAEGCRFMNGTDATARRKYAMLAYVGEFGLCDDGTLNTARVGSYLPNSFGIYDMIGNVGEWVQDCSGRYSDRPARVVDRGSCARRVVRGGSWGTVTRQLRTAERVNQLAADLDDSIGIRVAVELP